MIKKVIFCICASICSLYSAVPIDLSSSEVGLYSQNGEDGVLAKLVDLLSIDQRYCVELGAGDGITLSNTYLLRLQGWDCLLIDRAYEREAYKLHKEFINAENINGLFSKYNVPQEFGVLSIDVDYNDFHFWNALDKCYRPAIVVISYNGFIPADKDQVVKYRPFFCGDGTDYFGASLMAFYKLGRSKDYSLVYAESTGHNLFFVRDELLREKGISFAGMNDVERIYKPAAYTITHSDKPNWTYLNSDTLIRP